MKTWSKRTLDMEKIILFVYESSIDFQLQTSSLWLCGYISVKEYELECIHDAYTRKIN